MSGKKNTFITTPIIFTLAGVVCAIMVTVGFSSYQQQQEQTAPGATSQTLPNSKSFSRFPSTQPNTAGFGNGDQHGYILYGKR